jgi:hypothetical protein
MTLKIPYHDINLEPFMSRSPDFNRKNERIPTERSLKSQVLATIPLTDQEKLFHIRICDPAERQNFSFLPGQFPRTLRTEGRPGYRDAAQVRGGGLCRNPRALWYPLSHAGNERRQCALDRRWLRYCPSPVTHILGK